MLRLPSFTYHAPTSVAEAASLLESEGRAARMVAGGTDLWPNMKRRHQKAETVISLMSIGELQGVRNGTGDVRVGSTTLLADIEANPLLRARYPAFTRAVASISSPPLRNMGTIGGNICVDTRCTYYNQTEDWRRSIDYCMKEEGTICWVAPSSKTCWAHSASDSAPVLCALKAGVRLVAHDGERVISIPELYRNDGIDYLTKRADEIVTEIVLPAESDSTSCRSAFWKLRRRGSIDFAVLSVAAAVWADSGGIVSDAEIFLGAVSSYPLSVKAGAQALIGKPLSEETIAEAGACARKTATPMDNTDFQAQWRGVMTARYTEAALREIAGLEPKGLPPNHLLTL